MRRCGYLSISIFIVIITVTQVVAKEHTELNDISAEFNFNWKFTLTDANFSEATKIADSEWKSVQLPHDWSIEDIAGTQSPFSEKSVDVYDTGYTTGGTGWYKKLLSLPQKSEKTSAILMFDGIYMDAEVYVNGQLVKSHHYGYTAFWLDIGKYLRWNEDNSVFVKVGNPNKSSRWYSGSGIYRTAKLTFRSSTHFAPWGTRVSTPQVSPQQAKINIETQLSSASIAENTKLNLSSTLVSASGDILLSNSQHLQPKQLKATQQFVLAKPKLWSPQEPNLYHLKQTLSVDGNIIDRSESTFGIRSINFDAKHGFRLNQKSILLKGMNLHHDHYMLGAASHKDAEIRRVKKIIDAGFNAVRTAHNPPSTYFLDAADKYGLLVINEVFDSWNTPKWDHINDYSRDFTRDWEEHLKNFIARDYNHPSVIMWSLGNEIPEQSEQLGIDTAKMLSNYAKSLDDTRPTTIGANTSGQQADKFLNQFDVIGYNYQEFNYLSDHNRVPERVMYGSETYSNRAFEYWQFVKNNAYIIGDFVWTGWDYLGEASIGWAGYGPGWQGIGEYPWNLAYCGEIDVLGFKRPSAFYRDVLWDTGKNKLSLFVKSPYPSLSPQPDTSRYLYWVQQDIHPNWTWPGYQGQMMEIIAFSKYPTIELRLNGTSVGTRKVSENTEYKATFNVPYSDGELTAVGLDSDNRPVEEVILHTTSTVASIRLTADRVKTIADGQSLIYVTAELMDSNNNEIYHSKDDLELEFQISGPGQLIGVGNANPMSVESFQNHKRNTFRGRLVAVIRSNRNEEGTISIQAKASRLKTISSNLINVVSQKQ